MADRLRNSFETPQVLASFNYLLPWNSGSRKVSEVPINQWEINDNRTGQILGFLNSAFVSRSNK